MKTGVVISTYNAPGFLALALASLKRQTRLPDQLLVADDGSGPDTRAVVDRFRAQVAFPVLHCWQEDQGFRKARILNRAIAGSDADYLIFCDGDMLLHPEFVGDHCRIARPGRYTQGRRIKLSPAATAGRLRTQDPGVRVFDAGIRRRWNRPRSRWLMRLLSTEDQGLKSSHGCNQAFWRRDLLDVNGYEERMEGWGREDSELCARLHNLGRTRLNARHWALAFHLHHPERSRHNDEANRRLLAETLASRKVRATCGIEQHSPGMDAAARGVTA